MYIKTFKQISKEDVSIAGGKGASLGEMTQAGILVPEGFVIISQAFDEFIEETGLNIEIDATLDKVNIKEIHTIENASEKIQAMINFQEIPEIIKSEILTSYQKLNSKFVAVRSSATSEDSASAAWAGQLDTFLNTTEELLLENVKKCWASLFTPRAIFYRFEKRLHKDKISVAVVIQKMVDSEESGIAFSVHPITQDENQMIIEAGYGLGEAIVSGAITPDSYVIDKQGFKILDIKVNTQTKAIYKKAKGGNEWKELGAKGSKQVLTEKEIIELSKLIIKIENHYNFPCDIEWAKEKGKFYITQSRPITTLTKKEETKKEVESKDVYQELTYFLKNNKINIQSATSNVFIPDFVYEAYMKTENFFNVEYSPTFMYNVNGNEFNQLIPERSLYNLAKLIINRSIKQKNYLRNFVNKENAVQKTIDETWTKIILEKDPTKKLVKDFKKIIKLSHIWWRYASVTEDKGETLGDIIIQKLSKNRKISIENARDLLIKIGHPTEMSGFAKERIDFLKMCKFIQDNKLTKKTALKNKGFLMLYQNYLEKYFFYKTNFQDITIITSELVVNEIYSTIKKNSNINNEIENIYDESKKLDKIKKQTIKFAKLTEEEKHLFSLYSLTILWLDYRKEGMMKQFYYIYLILHEFEKRKKIQYSIMEQLTLTEILNFIEDKHKINIKEIEKRKKGILIAYMNDKKYIFYGKKAQKLFELAEYKSNDIKGIVASKTKEKIISGIARIINNPVKNKFKQGEILVTSMTRIEFVPLMKKAKAIITNEGGIACHAAIVSREFGIPCIIGTGNATSIIKGGDLIEVDTNNGIVKILKQK